MKRFTAVLALILAFAVSAAAADVTLQWDPNSETNLAGYRVYFGTASRTYGTPQNVGLSQTPSFTVTGLQSGIRYFFAVTAYNTAGLESGYSNEVSSLTIDPGPLEPFQLRVPITVATTRYSATIAWTTDVPTDGLIEYGLSPTALTGSLPVPSRTTDHLAQIGGLTGATVYYYRVTGRDANNVTVVSAVGSFSTR